MKELSIPKGKLLEDDLRLGGQAGISEQPSKGIFACDFNETIMINQWIYAKKWMYEYPIFLQTCASCRVLATSELRQPTVSLQVARIFFFGHGLLQKQDILPQKRSAIREQLGGCWTELRFTFCKTQVSPRRCHHQKRPYWSRQWLPAGNYSEWFWDVLAIQEISKQIGRPRICRKAQET